MNILELLEAKKDTHCSDKCCGADVKAEDCDCPADCKGCNCNSVEESLRPSHAKALRMQQLNKGKGAPKSGKTTGPDDYDFLKYKNKKGNDKVKEAGGYYTQPVYDMIEKHGYEKVMHELLTSLDAKVIQNFLQRANFSESATSGGTSAGDMGGTGNGFASGGIGTLSRAGTTKTKKKKKK
jgi:hypothetical protein